MSEISKNIKVGLILGGISGERDVSLETGKAVYKALIKNNYSVKLIDPALGKNQYKNDEDYWILKPQSLRKSDFYEAFTKEVFADIDVAFIGLHGTFGEDGITQTLLDLIDIPYVGSDASASTIGINKFYTKILGRSVGINFPKGLLVKKDNYLLPDVKEKLKNFKLERFIVKPNKQGSSLGLSVCNSLEELEIALIKGFEVDNELLIEEFIDGKELTVSILHERELPLVEIVSAGGLYDFEAKYESGKTEYIIPPEIPNTIAKNIFHDGMKLFNILGCKDYARVDFKLDENFNYYCLEINTLPGMTSHSLLPKAANYIGIDFESLINSLIRKRLDNE